MIVDKYSDLTFRLMTPVNFNNRLSWDIYRLPSAKMFSFINSDGNPECEPFNSSQKSAEYRFYWIVVFPSLCFFEIVYRDDEDITIPQSNKAFRDYVRDNIAWFNSVKFNDFREHLEPPIDISLLPPL